MRKFVRYGLKLVAWLAGILVFIWILLLAYVNLNQQQLIGKISSIIHKQTRGDVKIGDLSVSLIRTFPILSLQLSDVDLKDSLYPIHKKELLTAEDIYIGIDLKGLFGGNAVIGKILVRNGSINIVTDTSGFSNEYVLRSTEKKADTSAEKNTFPQIVLRNVHFLYRNPVRNKWHEGNIKTLKCDIKEEENHLFNIHAKVDMLVHKLTFNTDKGSYLKEKKLSGNFVLQVDKSRRDILLHNIQLNIDNHPFHFNGRFHLDTVSPVFNLAVSSYNIDYKKAVSVLNDTLASKLGSIDFNKPIDVIVELKGKALFKYVPATKIVMDVDLKAVNSFGSSVFNFEGGRAGID
ncbi:MAG: hypothetical protein J7497_17625, partial [Chitinophagaceae bacterium]|nr:hypothetical protein [Chitinophagaceae bacterium]